MTKPITDGTGVLIRAGAIAAAVIALAAWFNTRLSAVEIQQAEQKSDTRHIIDLVLEIKQDLKDLKNKVPSP